MVGWVATSSASDCIWKLKQATESTLNQLVRLDIDSEQAAYLYHYFPSNTGLWLKKGNLDGFLSEFIKYPELMMHQKEFSEFFEDRLKKGLPTPATLSEAVEIYAESLGEVEVYRGLALTPEEAAQIKAQGQKAKSLVSDLLSSKINFALAFNAHVTNNGEITANKIVDPFISVTFAPEVGLAVAAGYSSRQPGTSVYLIKIKIPKIKLVQPGKGKFISFSQSGIVILNNGKSHRLNNQTESVVLNTISPEFIQSVELVKNPPRIDDTMEIFD